jgi:hypothetical protein
MGGRNKKAKETTMVYRALVVLVLAIALAGCSGMQRSKPAAAQPQASTAATPEPAAAQSGSYMQSQSPGASYVRPVPPLEDNRKVNEQDCTKEIALTAGNLRCR